MNYSIEIQRDKPSRTTFYFEGSINIEKKDYWFEVLDYENDPPDIQWEGDYPDNVIDAEFQIIEKYLNKI